MVSFRIASSAKRRFALRLHYTDYRKDCVKQSPAASQNELTI